MEFPVDRTDEETLYRLVLGLIVPRPVGWISTVSPEGVYNLAPFSFFNAVNDAPPVLMVSISDRDDGSPKDTVRNILATKEFVVNVVSEDLLREMILTGEELPPEVDEFRKAGLEPRESRLVKAPKVASAKASFECRLLEHRRIYDTHLILGEALLIEVEEGVADPEGRIDYERLRPIGRLSGDLYIRAFGSAIIRV